MERACTLSLRGFQSEGSVASQRLIKPPMTSSPRINFMTTNKNHLDQRVPPWCDSLMLVTMTIITSRCFGSASMTLKKLSGSLRACPNRVPKPLPHSSPDLLIQLGLVLSPRQTLEGRVNPPHPDEFTSWIIPLLLFTSTPSPLPDSGSLLLTRDPSPQPYTLA